MFVLTFVMATVLAASELESSDKGGFSVSGQIVALLISILSCIVVLAVWYSQCLKNKKKKEKQRMEEEQMKWFEKQREQMKTPVKKSSAVKLHCASVPVARFRGGPCPQRKQAAKLPMLKLESSSLLSIKLPENFECSAEYIKSKKVLLRNLELPSSMSLQETESGESCLALEIKDSCSELRSPNVTFCVNEAETTLEYETK